MLWKMDESEIRDGKYGEDMVNMLIYRTKHGEMGSCESWIYPSW